jgi:hypothetical protein
MSPDTHTYAPNTYTTTSHSTDPLNPLNHLNPFNPLTSLDPLNPLVAVWRAIVGDQKGAGVVGGGGGAQSQGETGTGTGGRGVGEGGDVDIGFGRRVRSQAMVRREGRGGVGGQGGQGAGDDEGMQVKGSAAWFRAGDLFDAPLGPVLDPLHLITAV